MDSVHELLYLHVLNGDYANNDWNNDLFSENPRVAVMDSVHELLYLHVLNGDYANNDWNNNLFSENSRVAWWIRFMSSC